VSETYITKARLGSWSLGSAERDRAMEREVGKRGHRDRHR